MPILVLIPFAVNVLLVFLPFGILRTGAVSFPSHSVYKPLLLLNGAFLLYVLMTRSHHLSHEATWLSRATRTQFALLLIAAVCAAYLPSLAVNFQHHDWTHRHISAGVNSLSTVAHLFVMQQADGMYRPLTFLSLAGDYHLFGLHLWGYHLQSIAIHVLNAALVGLLATRLGFSDWSSRFAALLFGLESVHFEAVLWPAARFDLLAMLFSCLTLLFFLQQRYILSTLSFIAAALSKETAYSVLLILPALIFTRRLWKLAPLDRTKAFVFACALAVCAAVLVAVRFAVYGSLGGYSDVQGHSVHFVLTGKSVYLLLVNSLALSIFGMNTSARTFWAAVVVTAFVCVILAVAAAHAGNEWRRKWALVALTILSAIPVVNVIGWIQPSLQHSRHLYWPSLWVTLLLALVLERCRWRSALALLFLSVQAAGLVYNINVYRDLYERAGQIASRIEREALAAPGTTVVRLMGVPETPNGVFYFRDEIKGRLDHALPGVTVRVCEKTETCPAGDAAHTFTYVWDPT